MSMPIYSYFIQHYPSDYVTRKFASELKPPTNSEYVILFWNTLSCGTPT